MSNNKKLYSFITILFVFLIAITVFLIYFAYNITKFTTYGVNTSVGSVYVGGLYGDEAKTKINAAIDSWTNDATVVLSYQDYQITLDNTKFSFDVNGSIAGINNGRNSTLITSVTSNDEGYISGVISAHQEQLNYNHFNIALIELAVQNKVSLLYNSITIDIGHYMSDYETNTDYIQSPINILYQDNEFFSTRYQLLLGTIKIDPMKQFSLKTYIQDKYDMNIEFSDSELNVMATGIYQLILDTNFMNIQKGISEEVPNYTSSGLEAFIDSNHDLSFFNPNLNPYFIDMTTTVINAQNYVVFHLKGAPFVDTISHDVTTEIMSPGDIYWYQSEYMGLPLTNDDVILHQAGHEGYRSYVYRTLVKPDGTTSKYLVFEDIYMPKENIFVKKLIQ